MRKFKFDVLMAHRKVAIAAVAALFLFATEVRANVVDFVLVQASSSLKQGNKIFGPGIGIHNSSPQVAGSDTTTYFGHIYVDITPTTIQLMPGSYISAAATGSYAPRDPVISDPILATPGVTPNANYGLAIPTLGVLSVNHGLRIDNGNPFAPSSPMGRAGNSFNLAGQGMGFTAGRQAFVSGLGNNTDDVIGQPVIFFGTNGSDVGTWDGVTLTVPVHSQFTFNVTTDFGGIDETLFMTGQLVAVPYVPEPSTFTLVGFGIVGLLSYAWRARRKRVAA